MTTPQQEPIRVDVRGPVPLAVGTEIEVRLLEATVGLLGLSQRGIAITVLSTGIVYAHGWMYKFSEQRTGPEVLPSVSFETVANLTTLSTFRGSVVACRIITHPYKLTEQMTSLLVMPNAPEADYR